MAIPHLLSQESACSYQGYLLALMAVEQTRHFFMQRDGYLTDNPAIGPSLARHYWQPGNSVSHDATLVSLTGEGFNPAYWPTPATRPSSRRGGRRRTVWRRRRRVPNRRRISPGRPRYKSWMAMRSWQAMPREMTRCAGNSRKRYGGATAEQKAGRYAPRCSRVLRAVAFAGRVS